MFEGKYQMNLGILPQWDLSDFYSGPEAPELAADLDLAETAAECGNRKR